LKQFQEKKKKRNLFFQWVHTFLLSAYTELAANLMKALVTGKLLQTNKKAGHDFSFFLFPTFFVLTSLINQTHPLIPHYQVQSAIMFNSKGNSILAPRCDLQGT